MFIHQVLFEIKPRHLRVYYKDCLMWAAEAKKHKGFIAYRTLKRSDKSGQYASSYFWHKKSQHVAFFKKHHDRLVALSKCPVKVIGYFNYDTVQERLAV